MTTTLSPEMRRALLQALREDQEFREEAQALLLTQQLLQLPEQVLRLTDQMAAFTAELREIKVELRQSNAEQREITAELRQANAELREANAQVNRRLEWLENAAAEQRQFNAEQKQFNAEQRQFNAEQKQFNAEQEQFNAEQRQFNAAQEQFNAEQKQFNAAQEQFNAEQRQFNAEQRETNAEFRSRLERLDDTTAELRRDMNQVKGDVSQLIGSDVERKVQSNIGNILRSYDNALRQVVTLKGPDYPADMETSDRIADAQAAGAITGEEYAQLDAVDLIVRARPAGAAADSYFAIEISRTISGQDISRAAARADILGRALRVAAQGAVIGYQITEEERRRADADRVAVITYARLAPVGR